MINEQEFDPISDVRAWKQAVSEETYKMSFKQLQDYLTRAHKEWETEGLHLPLAVIHKEVKAEK